MGLVKTDRHNEVAPQTEGKDDGAEEVTTIVCKELLD